MQLLMRWRRYPRSKEGYEAISKLYILKVCSGRYKTKYACMFHRCNSIIWCIYVIFCKALIKYFWVPPICFLKILWFRHLRTPSMSGNIYKLIDFFIPGIHNVMVIIYMTYHWCTCQYKRMLISLCNNSSRMVVRCNYKVLEATRMKNHFFPSDEHFKEDSTTLDASLTV